MLKTYGSLLHLPQSNPGTVLKLGLDGRFNQDFVSVPRKDVFKVFDHGVMSTCSQFMCPGTTLRDMSQSGDGRLSSATLCLRCRLAK